LVDVRVEMLHYDCQNSHSFLVTFTFALGYDFPHNFAGNGVLNVLDSKAKAVPYSSEEFIGGVLISLS